MAGEKDNRIMKLTLRKSSAISKGITLFLSKNSLKGSIVINKFKNATELATKASNELLEQKEVHLELLKIQSLIRQEVGSANERCGINALLSKKAYLTRLIDFFSGLDQESLELPSTEELEARSADCKKEAPVTIPSHFRRDIEGSFSTGVIPTSTIAEAKNELIVTRRKIQEHDDAILTLNTTTQIEIPDAMGETLSKLGII
jgi:hypothetical protein